MIGKTAAKRNTLPPFRPGPFVPAVNGRAVWPAANRPYGAGMMQNVMLVVLPRAGGPLGAKRRIARPFTAGQKRHGPDVLNRTPGPVSFKAPLAPDYFSGLMPRLFR
jgi:hypothetical protein